MQRFFLEDIDKVSSKLYVSDKNIVNQILRVLRWNIWDKFIFFDLNYDFIFELKNITKKELVFDKIEIIEKQNELDFELNLFQSIPNKLEKIEYIVQKWTEIWISNFYFFKSERSWRINLSENKIIRIKKIIGEAVEQSGRNKIPKFEVLENLDFENIKWKENLFFHTKDKESIILKDLKVNYSKWINIFIWPEWGFSDEEVLIFEKNNFKKVFLWNRILRTETAWIVTGFYIIQSR